MKLLCDTHQWLLREEALSCPLGNSNADGTKLSLVVVWLNVSEQRHGTYRTGQGVLW